MVAASVDGSLAHDAPHGAIEIPALGPGESQEVILRLPAAATKPNAAGQSFNKLVVMIDPLDAVAEMDESNNTAVLDTI
jgi:subtilase family serine protease